MQRELEQRARLIGGVWVIVMGVLALLSQFGILPTDSSFWAWLWVVVFGATAVGLVWFYVQSRQTWAAIVAYIMGALALTILVGAIVNVGELVAPLVLILVGAPFVVAWWFNRSAWGLLIPAYVMFAIALAFLFNIFDLGELFVTYVLWVIAAPFLFAALRTRAWGFLIPGGILFVIGLFFTINLELAGRSAGILVGLVVIGIGAVILIRSFVNRGASDE